MFSTLAFKTLDILQGSVTTHLRCGGIFSVSIITNFLLILTVNNLENRLIFDEVKAYKNVAIFGPPGMHKKCYTINVVETTPRLLTADIAVLSPGRIKKFGRIYREKL